ncbi:MAG: hypothetical protein V4568_05450 [Pseudomonadota bacterium]
MKSFLRVTQSFLLASAMLIPAIAVAQVGTCPDHTGGYGPFDYTKSADVAEHLGVVEQFHFTPQVESLTRGASGTVGGDLDYTIRAFPNHHRALDALSKLSIKLKTVRPRGLNCSVEGYFERAVRFQDQDGALHMIYGLHLRRWKKIEEAKKHFELAAKLAPDDTNVLYNLGLVYADLNEWDKASGFAQKAYGGGFSLPGLKNKLVKAGKWKEPIPPVVQTEQKPAEVKAAEPKPPEVKSTESKPEEVKPAEAKPEDAKPAETTPSDAKFK